MIEILRMATPLTVWLAGFSGIYGLHGLLCSARGAWLFGLTGNMLLVLAWLLLVLLQAALLYGLSYRFASSASFCRRVSMATAAASLVASLWSLFPVVAISHCL